MAINPELITTIRVDQLPDEALSLTNLFPHTVGTDLKSATIQELVDLVATAIGVSGGVGYIAISVTDGQQLPDVPELPSFFLCGAGTFLNINGYPNIICTENLNAIMSLTDHWELAVEIPINPLSGTVQSVTGSAVDNTDPLNPVINEIIYGVQNIIAGTNITVDNTDPANPIVSATGGGVTPTLQEVLDNNHDLVDGNNFQGTSAGVDNTGGQVNGFGSNAALENTGNNVNALGDSACSQNSGSAVNALGDSSAQQNTGDNVNTLGYYSGSGNIGTDLNALGSSAAADNEGNSINALGSSAANYNTGNSLNALGSLAGYSNTGNNVNALGEEAGLSNAFNHVNLFGQYASADEDGQTVLSKDGAIMARISTTDLTETHKYNLPDADGTLALTSDITTPTLQQVTDVGNVSSNDIQVTLGSSSSFLRSDSLKVDDGTTNNIVVLGNKIVFTKTEQLELTTPTFTDPRTQTFQNASGTIALLSDISGGGGGGASLSFYLNGSVSQGTIGGVAFREMDRTPILGTGTDFTINADGYIQSFITDANVPNLLEIPA